MIIHKITRNVPERTKNVAAYCRVSTNKDSQEESFEVQIKAYQKMINDNPQWVFAGIYSDSGRTGTSAMKRPGFQRMIADAMDGRIDIILVKSISRFARNVIDSQRYVQRLKEDGIIVKFERENISTDDPASEFIFSLLSAIAQDESHSISENVKWAYRNRFERGYYCLGNQRILGYDTDKNGKLVPNQDAWIVKEIFARFLAGESYRQIAEEITAMGGRPLRTNHPFSPETIRNMVSNETYVGDKLLQKKPPVDYLTKKPDKYLPYRSFYLKDDHEGLIDRETWEKVQTILTKCKEDLSRGVHRKGKNCHCLYGKLFCGECGAPYVRRTLQSSTKRAVYMNEYNHNCEYRNIYKAWSCRERQKGKKGNGCKNLIIREDQLLEQISRQLKWPWYGEAGFDFKKFEQEVQSVKIEKEQIVVEVRSMDIQRL